MNLQVHRKAVRLPLTPKWLQAPPEQVPEPLPKAEALSDSEDELQKEEDKGDCAGTDPYTFEDPCDMPAVSFLQ